MALNSIGYDSYKYPEIKLDEAGNYQSANTDLKRVTVEEWNDLLHHTHKAGTFVDDNGNFIDPSQDGSGSGDGISYQEFQDLKNSVNTLVETVNGLASSVASLVESNAALVESNASLVERVTALENSQGGGETPGEDEFVIDYDPDTPGTQDINGNNVPITNTASSIQEVNQAINKSASSGDTISVTADLPASDNLITVSGKDITIDMNGNNIVAGNKPNNGINVTNGKLTLKNANVSSNEGYDSAHNTGVITVRDGGNLVLEGTSVSAVIESDPVNKGQFGIVAYDNGDITVESGEITTGWYCISGNGSLTNADSDVVINGGKLTSTVDYALYQPHPGTITINGGEITGGAGAISANNGNVVINGGILKTTGDGDTGNWNDGTSGQTPAVINLNGKYGAVSLTINGGKFIALNNAPIVVSGSAYPVTISIKGGEFSSKPNSEWIAPGFVCSDEPNAEGFYVVSAQA